MGGAMGGGTQDMQRMFQSMHGNAAMQGFLPLLMMGLNAMQTGMPGGGMGGGMGRGGMGGGGMGGGMTSTGGRALEPGSIPHYRLRGYAGPDAPVAIEYLPTSDQAGRPAAANSPDGPEDNPPADAGAGDAARADDASRALPLSSATAALVATAKDAVMKKPACAASKAKAKAKPKASGKAKAKAKAAPCLGVKYRKRARPNGCSKCRGKVGCTESCVRSNTVPW